MDDFENKLGQILGNPEMMGKIMAMAQSFSSQETASEPPLQQEDPMQDFDMATIQKIIPANLSEKEKTKVEKQKADLNEKLDTIQMIKDTLSELQNKKE